MLLKFFFLLDFSSAFDCVDHSIAYSLKSLNYSLVLRHLLFSRLPNSLTNRSHLVRLGTNSSKYMYFNILFGVPQRSILVLICSSSTPLTLLTLHLNMVSVYTSTLTIHNYTSDSLPKTLLMLHVSLAYSLVSLIYKHGVQLCV